MIQGIWGIGRKKSSPLPYDAEVEYLESVGSQYIDTGISVCNSVLGTEIKFQATETTNDKWVFGSFDSALGNNYNYLIGIYGGWNIFLSNGQYKPGTATDTNVHVVKINIDGKTQFDDVLLYTGDVIKSYDGAYSTNAWIFQTHRQEYGMPYNSYYLKAKVFYCKMYQDGVLVRDFIPVRFTNEQNQNEGAMYDRVSGALFRNAGTDEFLYGRDIL